MAEGKIFTCPTCGGSLSLENAGSQVECPYCGNMVTVPRELRSAEARPEPAPVPVGVLVNGIQDQLNVASGIPQTVTEVNRWLKWGIWALVAFIILTVVIPLVCTVLGLAVGLGGAFLPFFLK